ncbi:hypothetical protein EYF80_025048 [Liparis tanakae]|uniref:Uncharacterized protein n=1 Tax=Liparis tanakae TaxID=230148 RepID=A0A4Z2HIR2_9TELE|nr:hypothetical protein EYF80_025048 [Liparis tanakae]
MWTGMKPLWQEVTGCRVLSPTAPPLVPVVRLLAAEPAAHASPTYQPVAWRTAGPSAPPPLPHQAGDKIHHLLTCSRITYAARCLRPLILTQVFKWEENEIDGEARGELENQNVAPPPSLELTSSSSAHSL